MAEGASHQTGDWPAKTGESSLWINPVHKGATHSRGDLLCFFRRACGGGFLGRGALRGGLGGARQHAKFFEQLRLAAQGNLGDLEILRSPSVEGSQGGILFAGGLLRRAFSGFLLLVGGVVRGDLGVARFAV